MIKIVAVAVAALACGNAVPAQAEWVMAGRADSGRAADTVSHDVADRADLFLRAVDADRDRHVSVADVRASKDIMEEHFPGVGEDKFVSFMEVADRDGDGLLSRRELINGLAGGLAETHPEETLLEVDAVRRRRGLFKKAFKRFGKAVLGNVKDKAKRGLRKMSGRVDQSQDACVMCQYIVERLETNVRQAGVIPTMPTGDVPSYVARTTDNPFAPYNPTAPGPSTSTPGSNTVAPTTGNPGTTTTGNGENPGTTTTTTTGNAGTETTENGNFLELDARDPYDAAAGSIIAASRESTRMQRQMERQKYNEIYRVVDVTLDDVCEQSMPSAFYGFCKQIYQTQSDVVEGLRYQYRPADICFRTGMCGKESYITRGIHSRYQ